MKRFLIAAAICACVSGAAAQTDKTQSDRPDGSLSDKLDRTDGVVQPPANVDPKMKTIPPPDGTARTPVIPPPQEKDGRKIDPK